MQTCYVIMVNWWANALSMQVLASCSFRTRLAMYMFPSLAFPDNPTYISHDFIVIVSSPLVTHSLSPVSIHDYIISIAVRYIINQYYQISIMQSLAIFALSLVGATQAAWTFNPCFEVPNFNVTDLFASGTGNGSAR